MSAKIYFDTNVFIEAFERVDPKQSEAWLVLDAAEQGEFEAVTSEIAFSELLPKLISDGETELINLYERLFFGNGLFHPVPVTREILVSAAHLRAKRMSLRLPDAIHLATAASSACVAILSNDLRLNMAGQAPVVPVSADAVLRLRELLR